MLEDHNQLTFKFNSYEIAHILLHKA